jgi:excisionase family DNA binding protein
MNNLLPLASQHLLDLSVVAKRTGRSRQTWRRIIARGEIGIVRLAGSVLIPEQELERFLAERFVPARVARRATEPQEIKSILDRHLPRRRGRPKIATGGGGDAA